MNVSQRLELRCLLEGGLPLTPRPYQRLAEWIGSTEDAVIKQVTRWQRDGLFRRMGLVIRHRNLGFDANAMLVLDIADEAVELTGQLLGEQPRVSLCYQRPRRLPQWPYNLFCMIHGRSRPEVEAVIQRLLQTTGLQQVDHRILFSTHAFKQRGGRYATTHKVPERHG